MPDTTTAAEVISRLRRWAETLPPDERDEVLSWVVPPPAPLDLPTVPAARTPAETAPPPAPPVLVPVATLRVRTGSGADGLEVTDVAAEGPRLRARRVDGPSPVRTAAVSSGPGPGDVVTADAAWDLETSDGARLTLDLRARGAAGGGPLPLACAPVVTSDDPRCADLVRACLHGRGRVVPGGVDYDLVEVR